MVKCGHMIFPRGPFPTMEECSRPATWLFRFEYGPRSGETPLCTQHYKMQYEEDPTGRVSGNTIEGDPWVPLDQSL